MSAEVSDGKTVIAPFVNRKVCWQKRDDFLLCYKSKVDPKVDCLAELKIFADNCPTSWVTHFCQQNSVDVSGMKVAK